MHRHTVAAVVSLASIAVLAASGTPPAAARGPNPPPAKAPGYSLTNVGAFGGEPTIAANGKGELYDTTPSGGTILYKSTDQGATWTQATTADPSSGDDCVFTDQSNSLYVSSSTTFGGSRCRSRITASISDGGRNRGSESRNQS